MKRKLIAKWSKKENCLGYEYPDFSSNGQFLHNIFTTENLGTFNPFFTKPYAFTRMFNGTILEELDRRGYDIKTLKFSIERKK